MVLEVGSYTDNAIVVLWYYLAFQLGEKSHFVAHSIWTKQRMRHLFPWIQVSWLRNELANRYACSVSSRRWFNLGGIRETIDGKVTDWSHCCEIRRKPYRVR